MLILSLLLTIPGILFITVSPVNRKSYIAVLFVIINAVFTSIPAVHVILGNTIDFSIAGIQLFGPIPLRIDSLSAWFILIINFISVNGSVYGIGYMSGYNQDKAKISFHWILFLVFHLSMIWVCIIQHTLAFIIVWEIMSLSSLLLVIFEYEKSKTLKAGINYLVQMHIGVILLTVAFIWVYFNQGTFDFKAIRTFFETHSNIWLFILLFAGFGIKAGFIPFHSWLPHAHPAAPSHISGVMSGVIVKLGIYGIFRTITYLTGNFTIIGQVVIIISVLTGLFGILNSAVHRNFKKMLAYCTIENIGIIGIGTGIGLIGIGTENSAVCLLGFGGALLHTLNHSLFKSLLFFASGSVYQQTHTRNMEKLGGLIKKMPKTAIIFLIGSVAIAGLPPFNGFVSEFILYKGMLEGIKDAGFYNITLFTLSFASLAIIGGLSVLTFTKSFGTIFLGVPRKKNHGNPTEVSLIMLFPQYLIIAAMISVALFPAIYFKIASIAASALFPQLAPTDFFTFSKFIKTLSSIGIYTIVFISLAILVYLLKQYFSVKNNPVSPTWGCGFVAPKVSMQYTNKSFSKTLGKMLGVVLSEKKKYKELTPAEVFPEQRKHSSDYIDIFESKVIDKINNRLLYFMNLFQFVQNGNMQMYILYGLFFIILIFIGTLLRFI